MESVFSCDYCSIEKFNSEIQGYEKVSFSCRTLHHWKQHIARQKHCINIAKNLNLEEDLVEQCVHCDGMYTKDQYDKHKERNQLLWVMKQTSEIYTDCSCNHFIMGTKRFATIKELKDYAEIKQIYSYGQKNNIGYTRKNYDKAMEIIKNKEEHEVKLMEAGKRKDQEMMEAYKKKKAKQKQEEEKKKLEKDKKKEEKKEEKKAGSVQPTKEKVIDNLELIVDLDETPVEKQKRERLDCNIPPVFHDDDACTNCGLYQNFIVEYSEEKLERYNIKICQCGEDTDDE